MPPPPPAPPPPPPPTSLLPPPPLRARRLPLPAPSSPAASLLFAPSSRSLAVLLADSSALLFPSLPPSSPLPTAVPPPLAAAACFCHALPSSHLLFLAASPSPASPSVLLRAWCLPPPHGPRRFVAARLSYKRRVAFALPLDGLAFGLGVRLAGAVNVVALHSLAAGQIWILAPRLDADGDVVELQKCAVVELEAARPVYAMEVALGRLLLGEAGGVRVFPLRPLVKGGGEKKARKEGGEVRKKSEGGEFDLRRKNGFLNGCVVPVGRGGGDGHDAASARKLKTVRVKQNSGNYCSFFVSLNNSEDQNLSSGMESLKSVKAVSIHPLCKKNLLVLDSAGVLHILSLPSTVMMSESASKFFPKVFQTYRLDYAMKVQLFAVFPSSSPKTNIFWVSDGGHSVHIMSALDIESPNSDDVDDGGERKSTTIKLSAIEAIFTSERVQDIVPVSKDAVLILGQGKIFMYGDA